MKDKKIPTELSTILDVRHITDSTFVLRFTRNNLKFRAGQHIAISLPDSIETREYSIYSGENDEFLEVLIKVVETGTMSKIFKKLQIGDVIRVFQPVGYFVLKEDLIPKASFVLISSGTGIAPYHSFVKSYSKLNYKILHGIRFAEEAYEKHDYESDKYIACVSRENQDYFHGRVTDYLKKNVLDKTAIYYLCGNYEMIEDVHNLLIEKGIANSNIQTEVYF